MLKAEFHAHTNYLQPNEGKMSPKELIDAVKAMGYDALTITEHYDKKAKWDIYRKDPLKTYYNFKDYAEEKDLLLIPGAEIQLKEGEVLFINFEGNASDFSTVKDLDKLPKTTMTIAAHPFYSSPDKTVIGQSGVLENNIGKFDAIEHCYFYTKHINLNKKAIELAKKYNKPLVGTSDVHRKIQLNRNYTLVDSSKNIKPIIDAVRHNRIEMITKPLSPILFAKIGALTAMCGVSKLFRKTL